MKEFSAKFDQDHKSIQMLPLADRVKHYKFNQRSVQDEMLAKYFPSYSTGGVMTFDQFIRFLDDHLIKQPGSDQVESMFEEIEEISKLYLDQKLGKAKCMNCLSWLRIWNDDKSRLRKLLDPKYTSDKLPIAKIVSNLFTLFL